MLCRPAKGGEIAERFMQYVLVRDDEVTPLHPKPRVPQADSGAGAEPGAGAGAGAGAEPTTVPAPPSGYRPGRVVPQAGLKLVGRALTYRGCGQAFH